MACFGTSETVLAIVNAARYLFAEERSMEPVEWFDGPVHNASLSGPSLRRAEVPPS
jgi:hypothetical protein